MTSALSSSLGSLAGNALGLGTSTVGVQNTAPLLFSAAQQAGQQAAGNVANRYGTLGLGDSTMATVDESAAKTFPFISAAKDVATLDLGAQEFNANAINAANAAYQNQLNQLNAQIGSLLGGGGGGNNPSGGSNPSGDIFTPGAGTPGDVTPTMVGDTPVFNI